MKDMDNANMELVYELQEPMKDAIDGQLFFKMQAKYDVEPEILLAHMAVAAADLAAFYCWWSHGKHPALLLPVKKTVDDFVEALYAAANEDGSN